MIKDFARVYRIQERQVLVEAKQDEDDQPVISFKFKTNGLVVELNIGYGDSDAALNKRDAIFDEWFTDTDEGRIKAESVVINSPAWPGSGDTFDLSGDEDYED